MNSKIILVARILLGLIFFIFGLNKFLNFIPPLEYDSGSLPSLFLSSLFNGGIYFVYLLGAVEVVAGALLLVGKYVPLTLIVLAPVTANILFFHLSLDPANGVPGYLTFALNWVLLFANKPAYKPLLKV